MLKTRLISDSFRSLSPLYSIDLGGLGVNTSEGNNGNGGAMASEV